MANKRQKLILAQLNYEKEKPYKVKKAFNIIDYDIGQYLDKKHVQKLIDETNVEIEISKLS